MNYCFKKCVGIGSRSQYLLDEEFTGLFTSYSEKEQTEDSLGTVGGFDLLMEGKVSLCESILLSFCTYTVAFLLPSLCGQTKLLLDGW